MTTRPQLIEAAMFLRGTPFVHQQRQPGIGMDCCGTVVVPVKMCGLPMIDLVAYQRHPNPRRFVSELDAQLDRVRFGDEKFGDVGACWTNDALRGKPHHLFWLVPGPQGESWMLHTWAQCGGVVWVPFTAPWPDRTFGFWRVRGLED